MDISSLLKEQGLTKSELAERLGIHNQNVNKMLNNPTEATIRKIADALGVPVWQLFASREDVCIDSDFFAVVRTSGVTKVFNNAAELKSFCESL